MTTLDLSELSMEKELDSKDMREINGGADFLRGPIYSNAKQNKTYTGFRGNGGGASNVSDGSSNVTLCDIVSKTYFCSDLEASG